MPKLEDQRGDARLKWLERAQKGVAEQGVVQKGIVLHSGARSIAVVLGETRDRDVLRYFEREEQRLWSGLKQLLPEDVGWELVEREIATNDGKCFGVFVDALGLEALLRIAAARGVALPRVDLVHPALVLPRAGPDVDILVRESAQPRRQAGR